MPTIKLVGLTKCYDSVEVLHGIDLIMADAEFTVLVGPSGRGATMLGAMTIGSRLGAAGLPITVGYMSTWQGVWAAYAFLALPAIVLIFAVTKFWRIK